MGRKAFGPTEGDLWRLGQTQCAAGGQGVGKCYRVPDDTPVWLNERYQNIAKANLERFRKKLEDHPESEILEAAPELCVPTMGKLGYIADPDLSDLYVSLLAKASIRESVAGAHPAFAGIIDRLSPDEARLLRHLQPGRAIIFMEEHLMLRDASFGYRPTES